MSKHNTHHCSCHADFHADSGQENHSHGTHNLTLFISIIMFFIGIILDYIVHSSLFASSPLGLQSPISFRLIWYAIAYALIGIPLWAKAIKYALQGEIFTEFLLMGVATLGAFIINQYAEGVGVILFYTIGEMLQDAAVNKSKNNIKALLDTRSNIANVKRGDEYVELHPNEVAIGEIVQVKVGEIVPLDGKMLSPKGRFNTSSLTGESKPSSITQGKIVLAGMINLENVIEIETTNEFEDSSISKILKLVQESSSRKAKTELFIRKFAKIYTPIIFFLAVCLITIPYFVEPNYMFWKWFERSLTFLVISCPCALVISIPLGYFGGIGAASRHGILVKGANYLDLLSKTKTVVMDKTGTLTKGVFKVQEINVKDISQKDFLDYLSAIESQSTHPMAKAITSYHNSLYRAESVKEIAGKGLEGIVNGEKILAGNGKLLELYNINYPLEINDIKESNIIVAIDNKYVGYISIADEIKDDAIDAVKQLRATGVLNIGMLSGDKNGITQKIAKDLNLDFAYGGLLPEGKVEKLEEIKAANKGILAFVGDGVNDAPVLALSDVGIAMGGLGSDAAIESADVVIQTDQPSRISTAIKIGKKTQQIIIQNITFALLIKLLVLILGCMGTINMWIAVFSDVGVSFIAILNSIRIQKMKF